jgi:hypothetical protein
VAGKTVAYLVAIYCGQKNSGSRKRKPHRYMKAAEKQLFRGKESLILNQALL